MTHTEKFLRTIIPDGLETALRIMLNDNPDKPTVLVGRYNDLTIMARTALDIDGDAETWPELGAIYFLVNPLDPTKASFVGDRFPNTLRAGGRSGGDRDIAGRYVFLVDIEAHRPSGVCATDAEKALALHTTQELRNYAAELGLPEPIVVDSGNGFHLYFQGDGANSMSDIWPFMLQHFDERIGTIDVKVDTAVGNASRIMRLPGTLNRKGENTPERPHRRCMVLSYPVQWVAITSGQLLKIASSLGYQTPEERSAARGVNGTSDRKLVDDIEEKIIEFIESYPEHLEFTHRFLKNGNPYFALRECPFVGRAHNGHNRKTAIMLGPDYVGFSCFSDGCIGHAMGDLIKMMESKTGRKSPVHFYVGRSPEDSFLAQMADFHRRMSETVLFRDDVSYDLETWQGMELATTTDPEDYGLTVDMFRDAYFHSIIHRCDTAEDDTEREFITKAACQAALDENLQHMGELMGACELWMAHRNLSRWSEDRHDPLDYLRKLNPDQPLTGLELIWMMGASIGAPPSILNATPAELAAINTIDDL